MFSCGPPGESCRQKLTLLYDDLAFRILWLVVPLIFAVSVFYVPLGAGAYGVLFLVSAVLAYVTADRLMGIRKDITNYQLGFDGERMVD
jgi:hypothetical protein